uniref:Uncharacterized protein n=1 Tax=Candidatus Kentrum sp. LPFa TaxID=2126335 RepID=A0A450WZI7_9GAMM|nr:MAG: hypothetical protein BECKLPF1236B_GA0070989_13093 [Candidatus Kentron sp. LPFa]
MELRREYRHGGIEPEDEPSLADKRPLVRLRRARRGLGLSLGLRLQGWIPQKAQGQQKQEEGFGLHVITPTPRSA